MSKCKKANIFFLLAFIFIMIAPITINFLFLIFPILPSENFLFLLIFPEIFVMFIPVVLYYIITKTDIKDGARIKGLSLKNIVLIILICIVIQPFMSLLAYIGMFFSENYVSEVAKALTGYPYFISLFAIAVVPAIFEELLMRKAFLDGYSNVSLIASCLINGLFFGMIHLNMQQFFYAALLGFIFALFVRLTGSILSSILGHFIINGSQITIAYLTKDFETNAEILYSFKEIIAMVSVAIPSVVITSLLLIYFYKNNKQNDTLLLKDEQNAVNLENPIDIALILTIVLFVIHIIIFT